MYREVNNDIAVFRFGYFKDKCFFVGKLFSQNNKYIMFYWFITRTHKNIKGKLDFTDIICKW